MASSSLREACIEALRESDLDRKCRLTRDAAERWKSRTMSIRGAWREEVPLRPGRPANPVLVPPAQVKKRNLNSTRGRIALLHALAHIELNAIDLALDVTVRFCDARLPRSFFDGWIGVADDEARHFLMIRQRLNALGSDYGDLPAHDGLWDAAMSTKDDLYARLAIVPLVLEARGLDVTPSLIDKMIETGDIETARILSVIYEDEKTHVAVGAKWFRFFCAREGVNPAERFQRMVRTHFRGPMRPPFNDLARSAAGLTPSFYRSLTSASRS